MDRSSRYTAKTYFKNFVRRRRLSDDIVELQQDLFTLFEDPKSLIRFAEIVDNKTGHILYRYSIDDFI